MVTPSVISIFHDATTDTGAGHGVQVNRSRSCRSPGRAESHQGLVTGKRQLLAAVTHVGKPDFGLKLGSVERVRLYI